MIAEMQELIAVFDMLQQLGFHQDELNVMVAPIYFGVLIQRCGKKGIVRLGPRTKSLGHYNELFKQACNEWNKLSQKQRQLFVEQTEAYHQKVELVADLVAAGLYPIASNDAKPFQNVEVK